MTARPPRWTEDQLRAGAEAAIDIFREVRMREPLEKYLDVFDEVRKAIENLLELTVDLSQLSDQALAVLADPGLLEALRYLAGPPVSKDDLETLAQARLNPATLRGDPEMVQRVIQTVLLGLDRNRFPWVADDREPTENERDAAAMASAALIASRRVMTARANESKTEQESAVADQLLREHFDEVLPRTINTIDQAPAPGQFCHESLLGSRKADLVIRLWDRRVMPLECKVSNSSTNSIKRLNNDAAVKAEQWIKEFGTAQTVPAAVLSGVFKVKNLLQAQQQGLTIWWAHDLGELIRFIESTRDG